MQTPETTPVSPSILVRTYQTDDDRAQLLEANLDLVKAVVDRMRIFLPPSLDLEDLYNVGIIGLMAAVRKFDPSQGTPFSNFAALHVRGAVRDELRRMDWTPRSVREKAKKLREAVENLEQRLGRPCLESEAAQELQIPIEAYWNLLDEIRPVSFVPLDDEAFGDESSDARLHERIEDESQEDPLQILERRETISLVVEQMQKMPDLTRKVLAMYYFENLRLSEIAAVFKLTEGRISQIHTQAVLSLRVFLKRLNKSNLCS
ncbi:MAG: FliA/WhiG family RNA polymerase sigma factor [Verrucomicrobia bacterium]|nr:FliA/WhiG family RNA polymerase sigma factor [Verrucomicrobiota bacterium]